MEAGIEEVGQVAVLHGDAGTASPTPARVRRTVILGVAESDAHVVANRLIEFDLHLHGFHVVNLGACTPVSAFCQAFRDHPDAEAVLVGSLNGHARNDLRELPAARRDGRLPVPVVLGGNLAADWRSGAPADLARRLGADAILRSVHEVVPFLNRMREGARAVPA